MQKSIKNGLTFADSGAILSKHFGRQRKRANAKTKKVLQKVLDKA